jgi:hypothetical protein
VWSSDDGDEWDLLDELDPGPGVDLITVRTGYAGWVVLGHETDTSNPVGWVSPDGACWSPLPAGVDGDDAAITADHLMLVQRVTYPETWITTGLEDC